MVPPPQEPFNPLGVDTSRPEGSASVKPIPFSATPVFGLLMVKVRVVEPFTGTVGAPNDFRIVGGGAWVMDPDVSVSKNSLGNELIHADTLLQGLGAKGPPTGPPHRALPE